MIVVALFCTAVVVGPSASAQVDAEPDPIEGQAISSVRWDPAVVPVCWENPAAGTLAQRDLVEAAAEKWAAVSALEFTGWVACSPGSQGLRILWDDIAPKAVNFGRLLNGVPNGIVLNNEFNNWANVECQQTYTPDYCIETLAVEVFAFAIGIVHEHTRDDTDTETCTVTTGSSGNVYVGEWDAESVMNDCNAVWNNAGVLSAGDIETVQFLYPVVPQTCEGWPVTIDLNAGVTSFDSFGRDVILGTPGDDIIFAGAGDDVICGRGGDDMIYGEAGNDLIFASAGEDTVWGGDGDDLIYGGGGNDTLHGDDGSDGLFGQGGVDSMYGDRGNDELRGSAGDDLMYGGAGHDKLLGQNGADMMFGDAGDDEIYGMSGDDTIRGGAGEDQLWGGNQNDMVFGESDADRLLGGQGNDTVEGGSGDDFIRAQGGADSVTGGPGIDDCHGGVDDDVDTSLTCEDPRAFP